ncbi:MAG: T9SS type A sorting domain-containing protein [Bacteroidota bacterium]
MKKIPALLILLILAAINNSFAQTIYTIDKNSNYNASCTNCTFNIEAGATLTISQAGSCNNCTFNGGNIDIHTTVTCQPCSFNGNNITLTNQSINPNSNTTSFQNVVLTANGASSINANTPVNITNSVFTFNGSSYFNNNGGQLDISKSTLNFFGNSYFNANAGPVNLKNSSKLVAGNGLPTSQAYIKINGPALNIYDNASSIVLSNNNNSYYNWGNYNSLSNNKSYTTTYPSTASTLNCGAAGQHACGMWSTPTVYGPAALNASGVAVISSLLPVVLANFTAINNENSVNLDWTTQQEINAASFVIERSANASAWEKIGTVAAKGNTSVVTHYSYSDKNPLKGIAYYRLTMVDLDGKKSYSDNKIVHASLIAGISFYPNPANDYVNISLSGSVNEVTIKLMNQAGQVLQERKSGSSAAMVSLNVQQYPRGMYILTASAADGTIQTGKLMIAH